MSDMPEKVLIFRRIGGDELHIGKPNESLSWFNAAGAEYVRTDLPRATEERAERAEAMAEKLADAIKGLRRILGPMAMEIGYYELGNGELPPDAVVASFMGGGASDIVTAQMFRDADGSSRDTLAEYEASK